MPFFSNILRFLILCIPLLANTAKAIEIKGYVFLDANKNGIKDKDEKGIAGISVSNQKTIVLSNQSGLFKIDADENSYIFVIKPSNYSLVGMQGNSNAFFYKIDNNTNYNFALTPQPIKNNFTALMVGDPQMRGEKPLKAFSDDIVAELLNQNTLFASILGDIADNDLSIYPAEQAMIKTLPYPVYHVFGNHDIYTKATSNTQAASVFSQYYGPDYFSFNEGNVHFVVLNNVVYQGWNNTQNKNGDYFGGLPGQQYQWLATNLQKVPKNKLLVIMSHIPFLEKYTNKEAIKKLFGLLQKYPNVLLVSGHLHNIENQFLTKKQLWNGTQPLQSITVGAACGSWWSGPLDERGLPVATCMDGSPNGYFKFNFNRNKYRYSFIAANHREDFQMRITPSTDTLTQGNLHNEYISINIFSASKATKVWVKINDMEPMLASNYTATDLFINKTYALRRNYDDWQPKKTETEHLWRLQLPQNLKPGIHKIQVTAKDINGTNYKAYKLIEVNE